MRPNGTRIVLAAWLALASAASARAASDWRSSLHRVFSSMDASGSSALGALKPLWEKAPELGAEWALAQTEPIILELEAREKLTPEQFDALAEPEQRGLIERAADRTARAARERAESLLGEIEAGFPKRDPAQWKAGLLALERRRLYLEPGQLERLDRAAERVNAALWESRGEAMNKLARDPDKGALSVSGSDPISDLAEMSVIDFMRARRAASNGEERIFAARLRPYSPALDPNRFFLLEPEAPLSDAILYSNPSFAAARHGLSMSPGLPLESFVFMRGPRPWEPSSSALLAHAALHEGFHQGDPPGLFGRLRSRLEAWVGPDGAYALAHILIEGFAELRARRAFAALLADGEAGKTAFAGAIRDDLQRAFPRPPPPASMEDWVDHWLAPLKYDGPFVEILRALEAALGGVWAVEDMVLRGEPEGLARILKDAKESVRLMGPQLVYFGGGKDERGLEDDFELKKGLFRLLGEILAGKPLSPVTVAAVLELNAAYHVWAHELRGALRTGKRAAFTEAVKAPALSPHMTLRSARLGLEEAARGLSWMPRWLWLPARRLFGRLGLPLL